MIIYYLKDYYSDLLDNMNVYDIEIDDSIADNKLYIQDVNPSLYISTDDEDLSKYCDDLNLNDITISNTFDDVLKNIIFFAEEENQNIISYFDYDENYNKILKITLKEDNVYNTLIESEDDFNIDNIEKEVRDTIINEVEYVEKIQQITRQYDESENEYKWITFPKKWERNKIVRDDKNVINSIKIVKDNLLYEDTQNKIVNIDKARSFLNSNADDAVELSIKNNFKDDNFKYMNKLINKNIRLKSDARNIDEEYNIERQIITPDSTELVLGGLETTLFKKRKESEKN